MSIILQHFPSSSMEEEKLKKQKQEIPTAQNRWKRLKPFSLHLFMSNGSSQEEDGWLQVIFNLYKQKCRMKMLAMDLCAPGRENKAVPWPGLSWEVQHGTVAAPSLDPMDMLSTDKPQTIFNRDSLSTEHGLKYLHLLNFPPSTQRVSGVHREKQNTLLLLHSTCLRFQSICSPHWMCSGNLQLLIWLTEFREHSEGRPFFHARDFLLQRSVTRSCFWTHSRCSWCDHTLPKACLNTALPSPPHSTCLPLTSGTAQRQQIDQTPAVSEYNHSFTHSNPFDDGSRGFICHACVMLSVHTPSFTSRSLCSYCLLLLLLPGSTTTPWSHISQDMDSTQSILPPLRCLLISTMDN